MLSTSFGFAVGIAALADFSGAFSCAVISVEHETKKSVARKAAANLWNFICSPPIVFERLVESHFHIGTLFEMDRIYEAHLAIVERENHGLQTNAFAEEANAAQKIPVGDTRTRENHLLSRRKIRRIVNAL